MMDIYTVRLFRLDSQNIMRLTSWTGEAPSTSAARRKAEGSLPTGSRVRRSVISRNDEVVSRIDHDFGPNSERGP